MKNNKLDLDYQALLQDILDNGHQKGDRTGTGTISVFGRQIRHKMSDGFPLLTTKRMPFRLIETELLWFLRGDTNIKFLVDNNCHIWDGDAYKSYQFQVHIFQERYAGENRTKEEFINKIKTDDEFAKKWGDLGPIYGAQWRRWKTNKNLDVKGFVVGLHMEYGFVPNPDKISHIDQITNLINDLKTNPDSRRLMVTAWNVGELDQMVLPPCHYGFQVYTRELSPKERIELAGGKIQEKYPALIEQSLRVCDERSIPTRAISLMWNQRSVDTFLGLPFNIASYGLLLEIIAKAVNMVPDELIGNLGDVHLYSNHIEQAKEQIGRSYTHEERHEMLKTAMGDFYKTAVDEQVPFSGGLSEYYESYNIPKRTREPYPLPFINFNSEWWDKPFLELIISDNFCKCLLEEDIQLGNYQSHPTIKAPLSN
jgi:thymidylate synthase